MRLLRNRYAAIVFAIVLSFVVVACRPAGKLPSKPSNEYNEVVRAFYTGLAALQVGHDVQADSKLAQVTQLAPTEPAGWANWGLLALRQQNFDTAAERLERARSLAPEDDQIHYLLGLLESSRGRTAEAIAALRKAVELNPKNLLALYKLAEEVERQGDENGLAEFQQLIQQILSVQPDNLAALLELSRAAAKRGDAATLKSAVTQIAARSSAWPTEVQQQVVAVEAAANGPDPRAAATRTTFLRNVLMRVPEYRRSLTAIKPAPGEEAVPFTHFLRLESPVFRPAPADMAIAFNPEPVANLEGDKWSWIGAISLGSAGAPVVAVANGKEVRLSSGARIPFPGGPVASSPSPDGILPVDFSYDFKTDLVLTGSDGVRLLRQNDPKSFSDVTAQTKLPTPVLKGSYLGAWAADIEADGDLDIVIGALDGMPLVLRNNGDDTFLDIRPFERVSGLQGFAWADLDADGDPDAAQIDGSGQLHIFCNERQGQFRERPLPQIFRRYTP